MRQFLISISDSISFGPDDLFISYYRFSESSLERKKTALRYPEQSRINILLSDQPLNSNIAMPYGGSG